MGCASGYEPDSPLLAPRRTVPLTCGYVLSVAAASDTAFPRGRGFQLDGELDFLGTPITRSGLRIYICAGEGMVVIAARSDRGAGSSTRDDKGTLPQTIGEGLLCGYGWHLHGTDIPRAAHSHETT